ncbi:unnamed protein product, partial [Polarella glacialis]
DTRSQDAGRSRPPDKESPPGWSSLSAEDRTRFGLDGADELPIELPIEQLVGAASNQYKKALSFQDQVSSSLLWRNYPDVLWGSGLPGSPSMAKTLAQLQAVGMTKPLNALEESERELQRIRLQG